MRMTMKKIIWMQAVLLTGLAAMWGCGGDDTTDEQPAVMPQVTFPVTESAVSAYVDDAVRFEAVIESPGPLSCGWFVDGKLAASTASMTYVFKAKGTYDVRFEASNTAGKVGKDYSVTVEGSPLKVEFSNEEETVSCLPGEEVLITATVVAGDKEVVHEWKVGDEVVSTTAEFKRTFDEAGTFTVSYRGVNGKGEEKTSSWTVGVEEKPLEIEFSKADGSTLRSAAGDEVVITATVKGGATGLVHAWKVGGDAVSAAAEFRHTFDAAGTYAVTYEGVNAKGEKKNASWTVEVSEDAVGYMFENFETLSSLSADYIKEANAGSLSLVNNPYPTASNSSGKVLKVDMSKTTTPTSAFFDVYLEPKFPGAERVKSKAIQLKVYLGKNEYYPRMLIPKSGNPNKMPCKINGQAFANNNASASEWKRLIKTDDWNVFVYDLEGCGYGFADCSEFNQIQFRPLVNMTAGGMSGFDAETNNRTVYYDDIEFLE